MNEPFLIKMQLTATTIAEIAEQRLRHSPYFFLKGLRCRFASGVLTLSGSVPYRQLRELAEEIVARIDSVQAVVNEVEVVDPAEHGYRRSSGA